MTRRTSECKLLVYAAIILSTIIQSSCDLREIKLMSTITYELNEDYQKEIFDNYSNLKGFLTDQPENINDLQYIKYLLINAHNENFWKNESQEQYYIELDKLSNDPTHANYFEVMTKQQVTDGYECIKEMMLYYEYIINLKLIPTEKTISCEFHMNYVRNYLLAGLKTLISMIDYNYDEDDDEDDDKDDNEDDEDDAKKINSLEKRLENMIQCKTNSDGKIDWYDNILKLEHLKEEPIYSYIMRVIVKDLVPVDLEDYHYVYGLGDESTIKYEFVIKSLNMINNMSDELLYMAIILNIDVTGLTV